MILLLLKKNIPPLFTNFLFFSFSLLKISPCFPSIFHPPLYLFFLFYLTVFQFHVFVYLPSVVCHSLLFSLHSSHTVYRLPPITISSLPLLPPARILNILLSSAHHFLCLLYIPFRSVFLYSFRLFSSLPLAFLLLLYPELILFLPALVHHIFQWPTLSVSFVPLCFLAPETFSYTTPSSLRL